MKMRKVILPMLCIAAAGAAAWTAAGHFGWNAASVSGKAETEMAAYKTETVKSGNVAVSISEDGSVSFGTLQQVFSLDGTDSTAASAGSESSTAGSAGSSSAAGTGGNSGNGFGSSSGQSRSGGEKSGTSSSGSSGSSSSSSQSETEEISLEVEEVYVKTGQVIQAGDQILKLTQDSIDDGRSQLEAAVHSAELKVRQQEISAESARSEAEYNYNLYLAEGKTAQETYDATIARLEKAVADIEEDIAESQELIDEYQEKVDDGYDYDDELAEEQERYEDLQDELTIAQNNLTTKSIEAKKTYEDAMTNYRYADQLYAIDTDGLEDSLNEAKEDLEAAEKALSDYEEAVGDGIVTAMYSGTVSSISFQAGDTLTDSSVIMEVTDPTDASVTVLVSQEDIVNISVGDSAQIRLDAFSGETFDGEVNSIETTTTMGSSTVNYSVKVLFTGDVSRIYAGMTGEATFNVQSSDNVLYVSNSAVQQDGTRIYVNVLGNDGVISEQDVKTGFSNGKDVEILEGLTEGQMVVIGK